MCTLRDCARCAEWRYTSAMSQRDYDLYLVKHMSRLRRLISNTITSGRSPELLFTWCYKTFNIEPRETTSCSRTLTVCISTSSQSRFCSAVSYRKSRWVFGSEIEAYVFCFFMVRDSTAAMCEDLLPDLNKLSAELYIFSLLALMHSSLLRLKDK